MEEDVRSIKDRLIAANIKRLREENLSLEDLKARHNAVASQHLPGIEQLAEQDALLTLIEEYGDLPECPLGPEDLLTVRQRIRVKRMPTRKIRPALVFAALLLFLTAVATAGYLFSTVELRIGDETAEWVASNPSGELEMPETSSEEYSSLADALTKKSIEADIPQWIPFRYSVDSVELNQTQTKLAFSAWYPGQDESGVTILVEQYPDGIPDSVIAATEKSKGNKRYVAPDGIVYYYYPNGELWVGTWAVNNCIATVWGDVSEEEMVCILKSIYKGAS